jgi:hypothetical protein
MKNISEENCPFDPFSVQLKNEWKQQDEVYILQDDYKL